MQLNKVLNSFLLAQALETLISGDGFEGGSISDTYFYIAREGKYSKYIGTEKHIVYFCYKFANPVRNSPHSYKWITSYDTPEYVRRLIRVTEENS